MTPEQLAEHAMTDLQNMIREITTDALGGARKLAPGDVAGVLTAQSNITIAAALLVIANKIGGLE